MEINEQQIGIDNESDDSDSTDDEFVDFLDSDLDEVSENDEFDEDEIYEDILDSRATFEEYVTFLRRTIAILHSKGAQRCLKLKFIEKFPMRKYLREMEVTSDSILEIDDDLAIILRDVN
ncbi:hypothetical protein JTB14_012757 [Gonioctena quinquepunctata]|nr:hypothetical protein JTB14_012757 [Gonioctena quinquepunctata]